MNPKATASESFQQIVDLGTFLMKCSMLRDRIKIKKIKNKIKIKIKIKKNHSQLSLKEKLPLTV